MHRRCHPRRHGQRVRLQRGAARHDGGAWIDARDGPKGEAWKGGEPFAGALRRRRRSPRAYLANTVAATALRASLTCVLFSQEWEDALIKHKVMDAPLDHAKMKFMLEMKHEDEAFLESKRDKNADASLEELEVPLNPNRKRGL